MPHPTSVLALSWAILAGFAFTPPALAGTYAFTTIAGTPSQGFADGAGPAARFALPEGIARDSSGNLYVTDFNNSVVRKIAPDGTVTTLAGSPEQAGYNDATGSAARFGAVFGIAVDASGNVYVTDLSYDTVRKISPAGVVTTLAGSPGHSGSADGTGVDAQFNGPRGLAVDASGNVYVADQGNGTIRKISPAGKVTTIAGSAGQFGSTDGVGTAARFQFPFGIGVDAAGNVYVSDAYDCTVREIAGDGTVTTLAGQAGVPGAADGTGSAARFDHPGLIAVASDGTVFVPDRESDTIRAIGPNGQVVTLAGAIGIRGDADGTVAQARFFKPTGVAFDPAGYLYVADTYNCTIRKITTAAQVSTVAGEPGEGTADGIGEAARMFGPGGITLDAAGTIYFSDTYNHTIRKIAPGGAVTTIAGGAGQQGNVDGAAAQARFRYPEGIAIDARNNLYVVDNTNDTIRKITPTGVVGTFAGQARTPGAADGVGSAARFNAPVGAVFDPAGNLVVSDSSNHTIRRITPDGTVTTIAGLAGTPGSADGPASLARFNFPWGLAYDHAGNLYIADYGNDVIRKMTPDGNVSTIAGVAGESGDADGTAGTARFDGPTGLAVDAAGNLFVTDSGNGQIRRIDPAGNVTTIGGQQNVAAWADGLGASALFAYPTAIATDSAGNLYIADSDNHTIRKGGLAGVATPTSRLVNISIRANLLANQPLIAGFYVQGGPEPLLIRGVGPGLDPYVGGAQTAGDPRLDVYDSAVNLIASNDNWGGGAALRNAFVSVGAFPLDPNSTDAAVMPSVSGSCTAPVTSPSSGIVLVEGYDAGQSAAGRLTNISARYTVGAGTGALIAGFYIAGTGEKTLLIRGVGPTLSSWGVASPLADPEIEVYNDQQQLVASNDNWAPSLSTTFKGVGAFALEPGSKDAAMLITLPPGQYTAQLSGADGGTGEGLIEVYDVGN